MSKGISNEKKEENRQLYRSIYEEYNKGDTTLALLGKKVWVDQTENMADRESLEPRRR